MNNYRAHKLIIIFFLFILLLSAAPQRKELSSSRLEKVVITEGNVERTDYKDENGNLVYASDKHYATMIKTTEGDTVLEEYFDAEGDPTEQTLGHCALLKYMNEDNKNYKSTYLDADGEVTENSYGYSTIVRTYNDIGKVETEHYFDNGGHPIKTSYGAFGKYNEYDENKEISLSIYLDEHDEPSLNFPSRLSRNKVGRGFLLYSTASLTGSSTVSYRETSGLLSYGVGSPVQGTYLRTILSREPCISIIWVVPSVPRPNVAGKCRLNNFRVVLLRVKVIWV